MSGGFGAPTIGTIRGTIEIDYDGKGIIRAQDDVDKLTDKSTKNRASLDKVANGLALFGGVVAAGFAVAANSAISFEKRLSAIQAVSGATAQQMDLLSKKALQLGADTKFSASEAALAMEELVKAGLSVEEVLNGAADATVNLAAAGEVDLPFAATIAANALNQFNLKATDLTTVVDNIAGAANASAIDVKEFGFSLSQVGAVAHLAGQSFEDTATAIALMGNAGIKGSDAGTSLKTFLNNLIPTTERQIKLFKELGLAVGTSGNAFIDAKGNYKSLGEIAGVLHKATAGLSESQRTLALETLFGSDAIRAAAVISNAGAEGFANLNKEMNKTSAAEVAATRMNNAAGSIEQLKGSLETLGISIGTQLLPSIKKLVDGAQDVVTWFGNLDKSTQTTILSVIAIVGALALTTAAFIKLVKAIEAIKVAVAIAKAWSIWANLAKIATAAWAAIQWVLAAAMNATFLIVILVIAIIGALVAGIILLWKHNETFRKVVTAVWEAVKKAIKVAVDWIVNTAWPWIQKAFNGIVDAAKWLWGWIVKIFNGIVDAAKFFIGIFVAVWDFIAPVVKAVFDLIVSIIKTAWTIISAIFSVIATVVKAVFSLWWTITSAVFGAILDLVKAVWGFIGPYIVGAIKLFWDFVQFVWGALVSITTTVFNLIKGIIVGVWSVIGPFVIGAVKSVWDFLVDAWNAITTVTQVVWTNIKVFLGTVWAGIVSIFTFARDRVVAIIDSIKAIVDKIRNFFSELKAAADKGVGPLIDFVKTIPGKIFGALGDLGGMLFDSGKKMIQGLINGINSMIQKAKDSLSNLLGALRKLLPFSPAKEGPFSGSGWTFNSGTALIEDFAKGIEKASSVSFDAALGAVSGVASSFPGNPAATPGAVAPPSSPGGSVNIGSLNLNGVWDFTDPMASRKIVGQLDRELNLYRNGFK